MTGTLPVRYSIKSWLYREGTWASFGKPVRWKEIAVVQLLSGKHIQTVCTTGVEFMLSINKYNGKEPEKISFAGNFPD